MKKLEKSEFKIKFDGEFNEIDANTLIVSLTSIATIVQEINHDLDPNKQIGLKVKALDSGSFLVDLELLESIKSAAGFITPQNIQLVSWVVAILVGLFEIRKFLKGTKPKSVVEKENQVIISNEKGQLSVDSKTYNIFSKNVTINNAISKNFDSLSEDASINAFEITDVNKKPLFSIPREDFDGMRVKSEVVDENKKTVIEIATLNIFKIIFEGKYKWDFYYRGNKISAKINDENFFRKIDEGEAFSKGDTLKVELKINQVFDEGANTYANQSYEIEKVLEHIPKGKQQLLGFGDITSIKEP